MHHQKKVYGVLEGVYPLVFNLAMIYLPHPILCDLMNRHLHVVYLFPPNPTSKGWSAPP